MPTQPDIRDTFIGLERAAPDRWITFDPDGYLALNAAEATEVYALIGGVSKITHSHKQASREPVE